MYSTLLAIIYLAFVSLGLPDSMLGSAWPSMHSELGVPVAYAGMITMVISVGTIVSSLQSDRLTKKLGPGLVTVLSVGLTAVALFGFSVSGSFLALCLWAVPYGLGAGAVDAALNNYVALHYTSRDMSWLHASWGVGAAIGPLIVGWTLTSGGEWGQAYWIVGAIQVALTIVLVLSLRLWRGVASANAAGAGQTTTDSADPGPGGGGSAASDAISSEADNDAAAHAKPLPLAAVVRIPGVPLVIAAFFGYCAFESTAILWASSYLVEARAVDAGTAAQFGALFLTGITLGRFLSGFVADRLGDKRMIQIGTLTALAGAALIALPLPTDVLALGGLVVAGLGCAPIYPAIIHSTPANFGRHNSQAVVGVQMAGAYLGTTLMPPLFGVLAGVVGMGVFPYYLFVWGLLTFVMTQRLNARQAQR